MVSSLSLFSFKKMLRLQYHLFLVKKQGHLFERTAIARVQAIFTEVVIYKDFAHCNEFIYENYTCLEVLNRISIIFVIMKKITTTR